jgi:hypothetical protein
MSCFVVNYCELKACQHWRIDNKCVKHNTSISQGAKYVQNLHSNSTCQIRQQIDKYRLEHLLEE